jgi:hypothetical protein
MTVAGLYKILSDIHPNDRDAEVRVVFHGYIHRSFNKPVLRTNGPSAGVGFNIVCRELDAD